MQREHHTLHSQLGCLTVSVYYRHLVPHVHHHVCSEAPMHEQQYCHIAMAMHTMNRCRLLLIGLTQPARCQCRWPGWQCRSHSQGCARFSCSPARPSLLTRCSSRSSTSPPLKSVHTCLQHDTVTITTATLVVLKWPALGGLSTHKFSACIRTKPAHPLTTTAWSSRLSFGEHWVLW